MPLHRLARTLGKLLSADAPHQPLHRKLELLVLEDRSLLSVASSGVLTGFAFVDANGDGVRQAQERALPGVQVVLSGRSTSGEVLSGTAVTGANGGYQFSRIAPGTYTLTATAKNFGGNAGSTAAGGVTVVTTPTFTGAQQKFANLAFRGLVTPAVSLRSFLASTPADDPTVFSPAGGGAPTSGSLTNRAPTVGTAIATVNVTRATPTTTIDLAGNFRDADTTNTLIRFTTSEGAINAELYDSAKPITVQNFLNYIYTNRYDNTVFHRHVANFVLQGGGFKYNSSPAGLSAVTGDPQIRNEPGFSNRVNTLAMAKLPNQPNSATDQWFVNLSNNGSTLDGQNGGFTVFGGLVAAADRATVNRLVAYPVRDMTSAAKPENSAFDTIPLKDYTGTPATFSGDTVPANFAMVTDVAVVQRSEVLTYSVVSNTNSTLLTASIVSNRLTLTYNGTTIGDTTITVRATDRFGLSVDTSFRVRRTA